MNINLDTNDIVRMFQVRATAELKRELDEVKWWEDRVRRGLVRRACRSVHSGIETHHQDKAARSSRLRKKPGNFVTRRRAVRLTVRHARKRSPSAKGHVFTRYISPEQRVRKRSPAAADPHDGR